MSSLLASLSCTLGALVNKGKFSRRVSFVLPRRLPFLSFLFHKQAPILLTRGKVTWTFLIWSPSQSGEFQRQPFLTVWGKVAFFKDSSRPPPPPGFGRPSLFPKLSPAFSIRIKFTTRTAGYEKTNLATKSDQKIQLN